MNNKKIVSVIIFEDITDKSSNLPKMISSREGLKCEAIYDINLIIDKSKNIPGADIWIINLNSARLNSKKFINLLPYNNVKIIISEFSDLAIDAYNSGAIDFLVKPVQPDRFDRAIERAIAYTLSPYKPVDKYTQLEKNNMFYNILQNEYRISDPCCEICSLVLTGKNRSEISKLMKISENTLKVYLREIYSRTIEKENDSPSMARSKFHLLYMFLNKMFNAL